MQRRDCLLGVASALLLDPFDHVAVAQDKLIEHGTGLQFLPKAQFSFVSKFTNTMASLPSSASVRPLLPPPGYQGRQGSCVGWSVGYGLASAMLRRRGVANALGSPSYIFNRGSLTDAVANGWLLSCQTGMFIETALSYLQGFGALSLEDFGYDETVCTTLPQFWQDKAARRQKVIGDWGAASDLDVVKTSLAAGLPALVGLNIRSSFRNLRLHSVYSASPAEAFLGGHAMLVVGYNEAARAFEVMNSWGTTWGNAGFATINYDTVVRDALVDGELRMYTVRPAI